MNTDDIILSAVNWEHGMLLTPEHFLRQERYFDSALLWMMRYTTAGFGLVGAGVRVPESERGAIRHDPIVSVSEDQDSISISVSQCRALSPSGCIIEVTPDNPVRARYLKSELEGVVETSVYLTCYPHEKEVADGPVDEFNPQMLTIRRNSYRLTLMVPAEQTEYSVSVGRLRRPQSGAAYEKDSSYIPPCASMSAFSELAAGWRRIVEEIRALAERYVELNRAMQQYLVLFRERGIDTEADREAMSFVARMVVALENCSFEILDSGQTPQVFFRHIKRFLHSAALYFDLSPSMQQYFDLLKSAGESEFTPLIERQRAALLMSRTLQISDDLSVELRSTFQALALLTRLERALEGKYIDFRVSASLEAMNFIFDRGGKMLYKLAAKPSRRQGFAEEVSIHFAQLRLEGRDRYRLILAGEPDARFEVGTRITVEIRLNESSGFRRPAINLMCEAKTPEQRNFEFDFEAPDVAIITDLRVSLPARYPIRTALLFARHRFYAEEGSASPASVEPSGSNRPPAPEPQPVPVAPRGFQPVSPRSAPWDVPRRPDRSMKPADQRTPEPAQQPDISRDANPPRRRRLE